MRVHSYFQTADGKKGSMNGAARGLKRLACILSILGVIAGAPVHAELRASRFTSPREIRPFQNGTSAWSQVRSPQWATVEISYPSLFAEGRKPRR
jgi:hypothetical protein